MRKWLEQDGKMNIVSAADDSAFKKTAIDMRRLALQLHYAGPEVEVMYDTLPLGADQRRGGDWQVSRKNLVMFLTNGSADAVGPRNSC